MSHPAVLPFDCVPVFEGSKPSIQLTLRVHNVRDILFRDLKPLPPDTGG